MLFTFLLLGLLLEWVESPPPDDDGDDDLPAIPYFLAAFPRRTPPEPVKESDDTPEIADAYVRAGGGG